MDKVQVLNINIYCKQQKISGEVTLSNKRTIFITTELKKNTWQSLKSIEYRFFIETGEWVNIDTCLPESLKSEVLRRISFLIEEYNKTVDEILKKVPVIEF